MCLLRSVRVTLMDGCRASNKVSALWNTVRCSWGIKKLFSISIITYRSRGYRSHTSLPLEKNPEFLHFLQNLDFFPKHYSLKNKLDTQRAALMFQFAVQESESANQQMPSFHEAITKTFSIKLGASLLCTTPMILYFQTLWSYIILLQSPANTLISCLSSLKG